MSITTEIASTLLGKKVSGSETYDPSILVAVPRYENREQYNIDPNNLPFVGYDIWHGYEFSTMTNTGKGALIGGGGGAAVGAGIGAIIGGGKGAGIGSAIGAAVGAGAGALIGRKMDKQQQELQAALAEQATVEETTDQNGLQAIKVTFEGGILFDTGKYSISDQAKGNLAKFAQSLNSNPGLTNCHELHCQNVCCCYAWPFSLVCFSCYIRGRSQRLPR